MEYVIYTFGGGEILWKVLNGIGILFNSKNHYFSMMAGLVASMSLIFVGGAALFQGAPMHFLRQWFFPVFLVTNLLFGIKATVNVIDLVDGNHQFSRVSNVPLGLAAIGSLTSTVSKHVTEAIENTFGSVDGNSKYTSTGLMFGARLASMAKTVRIKDPIMQENLKEYVTRCFMLPYVFTNIDPGKKAALESEDILAFIEANPHPSLGVYWRDNEGNSTFKKCSECSAAVKGVISLEVENSIGALAGKVFGSSTNTGNPNNTAKTRLLQYFGNGWEQITNKTQTAANIVQQELMINTYKQAFEDQRDQLGLGRVDGDLLTLNASRAQAQQNIGMLIKGSMADIDIPSFHSGLMALSMMLFVIIGPIALLPKGLNIFFTWMKVMTCLATWPILYAVLECLGQMYAKSSMTTGMMGYAPGLSILTQNVMADTAFNCYSWIQSMQLAIPPLSWALVSGGGYAMSQLAGSFTQGVEAGASKASTEMTDGNTSFGSQTLHHKSIANTSIAQQQMGPNIGYGTRVDNGQISKIMGPNGSEVFQEHQDQFKTNMSTNDSYSQVANMQSQILESTALNNTQNAGKSYTDGVSKLASFAVSASNNNSLIDGSGSVESSQAQESLNQAMDDARQLSIKWGVSTNEAFEAAIITNATTGAKFGIIPDLSYSVMAQGKGSTGKTWDQSDSDTQTSNLLESFQKNMSQATSYAIDKKGSISDNDARTALDQAQTNFNESKSYSDTASNSHQQSLMWNASANESRNKSISTQTNENKEVQSFIADKYFEGNKDAVTDLRVNKPQEFLKKSEEFFVHRSGNMVRPSSPGSFERGDIKQTYNQNKKVVKKEVTEDRYNQESQRLNVQGQSRDIQEKVFSMRSGTQAKMDNNKQEINKSNIEEKRNKLQTDLRVRKEKEIKQHEQSKDELERIKVACSSID